MPELDERSFAGERRSSRGCWVCGSTASRLHLDSTLDAGMAPGDVRITDSRYGRTPRLVRCESCGLVYSDPLPSGDLLALYEALEDPEYESGTDYRLLQMETLLESVLRARPGARTLLDVGAGTGLLVEAARRRGLSATGIEPSHGAVAAARRLFGLELVRGALPHPELADDRYDLVTAVDVVEHVDDPVGLLSCLRERVRPDGRVVVTSPDVASLAARTLGRRWWHYRAAHVCFFDARTMDHALERAGLSLERKFRQRWWFSVGYLAERLATMASADRVASWARETRLLAPVRDRVVPLNLFDSWVYVARPAR